MNNFKPCAHCNGNCIMSFIKGEYTLSCDTCPAKMEWFTNTPEAIEAWNRRDSLCDEISYFENGVELATNILYKYQQVAEQAGGKDCASYHLLQGLIEEIEAHLEYATSPQE